MLEYPGYITIQNLVGKKKSIKRIFKVIRLWSWQFFYMCFSAINQQKNCHKVVNIGFIIAAGQEIGKLSCKASAP